MSRFGRFEIPKDSDSDVAGAVRAQIVEWLRPSEAEVEYRIDEVEGEVPREIFGTLYRNGPSQKVLPEGGAQALHLFDGDGLVHAFRFEDGSVRYQSRFVRHESFLAEQAAGRYCMGGGNVFPDEALEGLRVQPNTNVVLHAGRLFAMVENSVPFEIDPKSLEPIGSFDYQGKLLGMSTTAHPKIDGRTGQMVIHGYQPVEPYVALYTVEPDGRVSLAEAVEAPWPGMMHDIGLTERHVVLPLPPVYFDIEVLAQGVPFAESWRWEPERGLKFGIRSREPGAPIRWFDAPTPGFIFHPGNAYEEDGVIRMDACTYLRGGGALEDLRSIRSGALRGDLLAVPVLYEFDLESGECREKILTERPAEFPRIDDRLIGYRNRWGYAATSRRDPVSPGDATFTSLVKYDREGGASTYHELAPHHWTGEPVFVPRGEAAAEDEGWVTSVVFDGASGRSCLQILDARQLDAAPVAKLWLRDHVPLGFHGNFAPGVV